MKKYTRMLFPAFKDTISYIKLIDIFQAGGNPSEGRDLKEIIFLQ